MVEVIDYRVSRIVVLCKDCGQDVGLYPARHKCGIPTSGGLSPITKESSPNNPKSNSNSNPKNNNSEGYNLWNKFMTSATAIYYADDDSDNESEKDDWDGETHISRILREYYENKGGDLPDWLYDSDSKYNLDSTNNSYASKTELTSTKRQVLPNRNEDKNPSPLLEVDNNRGRQNGNQLYNNSIIDVSLVQNHTSAKMNRGRDKSAPPPNSFERNNVRSDKYHENVYSSSLPKSIDSRITNDQIKNKNSTYNSLPSRRQPPPFPTTPDEYRAAKRLISSKSYNQLNSNYNNNAFNKVSPNRIKDIRAGSGYNNNIQRGNGRQDFGTSLPNSRVPNRNRIQDNYF